MAARKTSGEWVRPPFPLSSRLFTDIRPGIPCEGAAFISATVIVPSSLTFENSGMVSAMTITGTGPRHFIPLAMVTERPPSQLGAHRELPRL